MKIYEVIGKQKLDYVNKQGRRVNGVLLYATYNFSENVIADGVGCESIYLKAGIADDVSIGDIIEPIYNEYGSIVGIKNI